MIAHTILGAADPGGPRFSSHSRTRMHEFGVSESLVRDVLKRPLAEYPGGPEHRNNARVYVGHKIRVVHDPDTRTVITVQLRTVIPFVHGLHSLTNLPQTPRAN